MITEKTGNIFTERYGIICHQVNYFGVMGGGIAAAISDKLLSDDEFMRYYELCRRRGRSLLGYTQFLDAPYNLTVANMFCQDEYMDGAEHTLTRYDCMQKCFELVRFRAMTQKMPVLIPYKIGCGIAGGDWGKVKPIIEQVFSRVNVPVYIIKREGDL